DYDRAELDGTTYWQKVAAGVGRSFTAAQVAELIKLDIASWLHLRPGTVTLIEDLAAGGDRLAPPSHAPPQGAQVVAAPPLAPAAQRPHRGRPGRRAPPRGPLLGALRVQLPPPVGQARAGVPPGRAGHAGPQPRRRCLPRRPGRQRGRGAGTGHARRTVHRSR